MELLTVTTENIDQYLNQEEHPFIVDFWATWSLACLMYKEKLEFAREMLDGLALFGTVDIDETPELAERFSVITIPTTLIFWKGAIVKQYVGIQEPDLFQDVVLELIGKSPK